MEEILQHGIKKNRLPFDSMPAFAVSPSVMLLDYRQNKLFCLSVQQIGISCDTFSFALILEFSKTL